MSRGVDESCGRVGNRMLRNIMDGAYDRYYTEPSIVTYIRRVQEERRKGVGGMGVKYVGWSYYERGEQVQEVVGDTLSECIKVLAKKFACIPRHKEQLKDGGCVVRGNLKLWVQEVEDPAVVAAREKRREERLREDMERLMRR